MRRNRITSNTRRYQKRLPDNAFIQEIIYLFALVILGLNLSLYLEIQKNVSSSFPAATSKEASANKTIANKTIIEKEISNLPSFYGTSAKILGENTCAAYRAAIPKHLRRWAPAGMFNCGTNTLMNLLRANCIIDRNGRNGLWQAPWGKHNPLSWRGKHWSPQFMHPRWRPRIETIFPIMVIKDPLTWMKSMCRNHYEAFFKRLPAHRDTASCPSPVNFTRTLMKYQPTIHSEYPSLVDFWQQWNFEYWNTTLPHLIIRFEDLLFDSQPTISRICFCLGGYMRDQFRQAEEPTKSIREGHRGPINDRSKALRLYSSEVERYSKYSSHDLRFISDVLQNTPLLRDFNYHFSIDYSSSL